MQDRVNAGVAGDNDSGRVHALAVEVLGGTFCGGEVEGGEPPG